VLGFQQYDDPTLADVKRAHRVASKVAHPDNGGNNNTQAALNAAYADAKAELAQQ
jgi:curved DNA-binding protein CbpA